ncbi:MAG: YigZ family protein [Acidobacteriota bacterium]
MAVKSTMAGRASGGSKEAAAAGAGALTVRRVARPLRHEIDKIRGSRFFASLAPVTGARAAAEFVEARREELRDATHNCWAWRVGTGRDDWRLSDDGEPSGTGGRPILAEIDGRRLTDLAVVVTRYYGGTKLGTGGLIRAYGGCAAAALDLAEIVEQPLTRRLRATFGYALTGPVERVLAARGLEPASADYGARVRLGLEVPLAALEAVMGELTDAATGRIELEIEIDAEGEAR